MALSSPTGMARPRAMPVITRVAESSGSTPNSGSAKSGDHVVDVRNSTMLTSPKNSIVGFRRAKTMARVVPTESRAHAPSTALMAISP
jgi:hypothetical protein